jgi:DNA-directed RNA polymerase sigma subunit (sigma70/sigma32)
MVYSKPRNVREDVKKWMPNPYHIEVAERDMLLDIGRHLLQNKPSTSTERALRILADYYRSPENPTSLVEIGKTYGLSGSRIIDIIGKILRVYALALRRRDAERIS